MTPRNHLFYATTKNISLFHLAADLALDLKQPEQAYLILERSKSRVLVEQMLRERAEPGSNVDENLRVQYSQLRERLRMLARRLGNGVPEFSAGFGETRFLMPSFRHTDRKPEQEEKLWQELRTVEDELAKVRNAISEQDPAFGQAIQPSSLKPEDVAAFIPSNTLGIAFEQRPEFLRLYPLTAQGVHSPLKIDISTEQLSEQVSAFREKITNKIGAERADATLNIRDWLTKQLEPKLTQLTEQHQPREILLIPHQSWHLLPLHLIQIKGEPLCLRYPVRYIPALQVLRLIRERRQAATGNGCIIADPDATLPAAKIEGQAIKALRPEDILLEGEKAMLTAVRQHLAESRHGHFACHGYFAPDLNAGILLADGTLQAKELFASLRLPNPRLVVLSACETAQIQPTIADDYNGIGLRFSLCRNAQCPCGIMAC
jgi:CHAT domain-containing protein